MISDARIHTVCSLLYVAFFALHKVSESHPAYWIWISAPLYELYDIWTNDLNSVFLAEKWSYVYLSAGVVLRLNHKVPGLVFSNCINMDIINIIYITVYFSFTLSSYQREEENNSEDAARLKRGNQHQENTTVLSFLIEKRCSPEFLPPSSLSPLALNKLAADSTAFSFPGSILPLPESSDFQEKGLNVLFPLTQIKRIWEQDQRPPGAFS